MTTAGAPSTTLLDPDGFGAGAVAAATSELIGVLAEGAAPHRLAWDAAASPARVVVDGSTRHPLLLITLLADLGTDAVQVTPELRVGADATLPQPATRFAPYTAAGSALVAAVPAVGDGGTCPPLVLSCAATRRAGDAAGTGTALTPDEVRALLRVDLVEGRTGRLLAVVLDEKARLRRAAREIQAMRTLRAAARNALDRIGADLACPRFADDLVWDPDRRSPGSRPLAPAGTREPDAAYRARLALLRGVRLPSPVWIDSAVNGAGAPTSPGAGWMSDVGLGPRVAVDESANPLLVALRLVAPGADGALQALLDAVRRVHLVWPAGSAAGDAIHAVRLVSPLAVQRTDAVRAALRSWQLPDGQPVAPTLATALALLDDVCRRLGARPWPAVLAGQSDEGGSRFELGLGALMAAPDPVQLDQAVLAAHQHPELGLVPRPRAEDPAGAWLLRACKMRTAEADHDGTVFVSTVPMGSLVVDVSPGPQGPAPLSLTARLQAGTDAAHDAPMVAVRAALAAQVVPAAAPDELLAAAQPTSAAPALAAVVGALGLPAVTAVADFRRQLASVSSREYEVFDLGPDLTGRVQGTPALLAALLATAAGAGASSVVPVVTAANTLALVLGISGLPLAGSNLAARHTVLHRWGVRALGSQPVDLRPRRGPTVTVRAAGAGISVVSCLVHLRTGGNDPYEWRPALPSGALLTLRQYEHLLNVVELVTPIGVRANTWEIRQHHVDVDGSGRAVALTPGAARAYRRYRQAR